MLEVFETLHAQADGFLFFAMCLEFTGMDVLCRIYGTSFMMDRTAWNPLQGDFNLAL